MELYQRVGGWPHVARIPRWFDEGVAVVVAGETRHSEANRREIQTRGIPAPALAELVSRSDWNAALIKYGETHLEDPGNLHAVYSAAAHELSNWLACAAPAGAAALLTAVSEGGAFDSAYQRIGGNCAPMK